MMSRSVVPFASYLATYPPPVFHAWVPVLRFPARSATVAPVPPGDRAPLLDRHDARGAVARVAGAGQDAGAAVDPVADRDGTGAGRRSGGVVGPEGAGGVMTAPPTYVLGAVSRRVPAPVLVIGALPPEPLVTGPEIVRSAPEETPAAVAIGKEDPADHHRGRDRRRRRPARGDPESGVELEPAAAGVGHRPAGQHQVGVVAVVAGRVGNVEHAAGVDGQGGDVSCLWRSRARRRGPRPSRCRRY